MNNFSPTKKKKLRMVSYMLAPAIREIEYINSSRLYDSMANRIERVVSSHFGISIEKIRGKRRYRDLAFARQVCCYLMRKHTNMGCVAIGNRLGGRDHATVLHNANVIKDLMSVEDAVLRDVKYIEKRVVEYASMI
jgi:chromosomal replication initiator protein